MRILIPALALSAVAGQPSHAQSEPASRPTAQRGVWRPLFDGKTLTGWRQAGGQATYAIEDGAIVGTTAPNTPNTFLCTEQEFGDFEFEFEFQVDAELNSGVQFRSFEAKHRVRGYQFEIDPSKRSWTSGIYFEGGAWLANLEQNETARTAFRAGTWNQGRVVCRGPRLQTWLNGVASTDTIDARRIRGFLGLQVHGVGKRADPLQVRWRNLRIREHGAHAWRSLRADTLQAPDPTRRTVTESGVRIVPGAAAARLVSTALRGDFAFRCQFRVTGGEATVTFGDRTVELTAGKPDGPWQDAWIARVGDRVVLDAGPGQRRQCETSEADALRIEVAPEASAELRQLERLTPAAAAAASRSTRGRIGDAVEFGDLGPTTGPAERPRGEFGECLPGLQHALTRDDPARSLYVLTREQLDRTLALGRGRAQSLHQHVPQLGLPTADLERESVGAGHTLGRPAAATARQPDHTHEEDQSSDPGTRHARHGRRRPPPVQSRSRLQSRRRPATRTACAASC